MPPPTNPRSQPPHRSFCPASPSPGTARAKIRPHQSPPRPLPMRFPSHSPRRPTSTPSQRAGTAAQPSPARPFPGVGRPTQAPKPAGHSEISTANPGATTAPAAGPPPAAIPPPSPATTTAPNPATTPRSLSNQPPQPSRTYLLRRPRKSLQNPPRSAPPQLKKSHRP